MTELRSLACRRSAASDRFFRSSHTASGSAANRNAISAPVAQGEPIVAAFLLSIMRLLSTCYAASIKYRANSWRGVGEAPPHHLNLLLARGVLVIAWYAKIESRLCRAIRHTDLPEID